MMSGHFPVQTLKGGIQGAALFVLFLFEEANWRYRGVNNLIPLELELFGCNVMSRELPV